MGRLKMRDMKMRHSIAGLEVWDELLLKSKEML